MATTSVYNNKFIPSGNNTTSSTSKASHPLKKSTQGAETNGNNDSPVTSTIALSTGTTSSVTCQRQAKEDGKTAKMGPWKAGEVPGEKTEGVQLESPLCFEGQVAMEIDKSTRGDPQARPIAINYQRDQEGRIKSRLLSFLSKILRTGIVTVLVRFGKPTRGTRKPDEG